MKRVALFVVLFLALAAVTRGEVALPVIFSDDMVLQRELPVPVWGTADVGEQVTVTFAGQTHQTTADSDGRWMVQLAPLTTSRQPQTLLVEGNNQLELSGVLVGEVWLCSGQSNMADSFNSSKNRFIEPESFQRGLTHMRVSTRQGWTGIDEKTQRTVSRVGFYFGEKLYRELDVPIGLILRYNSGTPIQSWMAEDQADMIRQRLGIPAGWNDVQANRNPGVQFADKIAPILPFCFRGVIWYQGERNAKTQTGFEYRQLLPFLIEHWRERFALPGAARPRAFPFYYVQVPTQEAAGEWPWLRDSMRRALDTTQNTGMAVFYDHGPSLHPHNKKPAGVRLALWALARDYGRSELPHSGPLLKQIRFRDQTAELSFDHVAGGLRNPTGDNSQLDHFEIAGEDGQYVTATASIAGDQVHVSSPQIRHPKYVRYLFRKQQPDPAISLVNSAGLPASGFITDDFPPNRETTGQGTPKRRRTAAEPLRERSAQPAVGPMSAKELVALTASTGTAPRIANLTADDVSWAKEQQLADLQRPFLDFAPEDMADGIEVGELGLDSGNREMIMAFAREIAAGRQGDVDSLLIHHDGRLIFESYYRRGRVNYPHYQMSITKSYTALLLGRALQKGHLQAADLQRPVVEFLKQIDRSKMAVGCETITLGDALNMHSGIRIDRATEARLRRAGDTLQGQRQIQAYFEHTAPITAESKQYKYQSCDPSIVMQVVESVVPGTAKQFASDELLGPLGISNFGWQEDVSGLPKSAAGSSLRSRDMIKFGLLVQSGGRWDGQDLIPASFLSKATSRIHTNPEGTSYGYFWWRHSATVDGKTYDIKSARGAGGQFILVIDELVGCSLLLVQC